MPSRRQLLTTLGATAALGSLVGCASADATTGAVAREQITVGGTTTVSPYVDDGVGHLDVREATPPDRAPAEVTIGQFELDERPDRK